MVSFDIQLKHNPEKAPHPKGQDAFNVMVTFPWQQTPLCRIKVEITHDEPVILSPEYKPILHGYEEQIDCTVACYHIEEIVAEKLRALLQTHQKLIARGWNRPRARDYYDLWCILKNYSAAVDTNRLIEMLDKKCKHREVSYQNINDFFTPELVKQANQHWQATLGVLVRKLPARPNGTRLFKSVRRGCVLSYSSPNLLSISFLIAANACASSSP
jgi:predicted nucleotidyltransferase component of viral defense system